MHTSVGLDKLTKSMNLKSGQGQTIITNYHDSCEKIDETSESNTGASPHSKQVEANEDNTDHDLFNNEFLQDWKEVSLILR